MSTTADISEYTHPLIKDLLTKGWDVAALDESKVPKAVTKMISYHKIIVEINSIDIDRIVVAVVDRYDRYISYRIPYNQYQSTPESIGLNILNRIIKHCIDKLLSM